MTSHPGRSRRLLLAALAVTFLICNGAGAAWANQLNGSLPADGAKLTTAPGEVVLSFKDQVFFGGTTVSVVGPNGNVASGSPQVQGNQVTQGLRGGLAKGTYQVSWKITTLGQRVQQDSGGLSFIIGVSKPKPKATKTPATPTPSATPTATSTPRPHKHARTATPTSSATSPTLSSTVIAAPDIQGVSYTGADRLPSPPVVWAVLIGAAIVIFLITRWQRGRAR